MTPNVTVDPSSFLHFYEKDFSKYTVRKLQAESFCVQTTLKHSNSVLFIRVDNHECPEFWLELSIDLDRKTLISPTKGRVPFFDNKLFSIRYNMFSQISTVTFKENNLVEISHSECPDQFLLRLRFVNNKIYY